MNNIDKQYQELLKDILENKDRRMSIIKDELIEVKSKYGDERRSKIEYAGGDLSIEPNSTNSLSIKGDGSNVVLATSSYVEVYEYIGGSWMKKGSRINQEASSDYSNAVEILARSEESEYQLDLFIRVDLYLTRHTRPDSCVHVFFIEEA